VLWSRAKNVNKIERRSSSDVGGAIHGCQYHPIMVLLLGGLAELLSIWGCISSHPFNRLHECGRRLSLPTKKCSGSKTRKPEWSLVQSVKILTAFHGSRPLILRCARKLNGTGDHHRATALVSCGFKAFAVFVGHFGATKMNLVNIFKSSILHRSTDLR
jgi:hypothetical protein